MTSTISPMVPTIQSAATEPAFMLGIVIGIVIGLGPGILIMALFQLKTIGRFDTLQR